MSITVRLADLESPSDRAAIVELLDMYCRDEFGNGQPLSPLARENLIPGLLAHGGARVFLAQDELAQVDLAQDDDAPLGVAICLLGFSSFRGRPLLNIHDIAVRPSARGRGIGRRLLAAVESEARALGCCKVTLEVRSDNVRAMGLYRSVGFAPSAPETYFWSAKLD